ncbi:MAG: phospholipase C, phosphocholine-specific [Acidobacteria bacterium]|nr:phospholipase C, phosphocholine-specific [Acidobacteriota bacterium]
MQTRRDFLKRASMLAGAGASGAIPESIQRAFAIDPEPGSTYLDAEHIVILMQENRSFDHALGTLQGVRGFNDPRSIRTANGNSVFLQSSVSGETYAPWRLDIKDTKVTWMGSIPHTRHSQVDAWNHGHHNGWVDAKRSGHVVYSKIPLTMGHYTRADLPFYYALADAFTVMDQHYCGVMSSTTPNRCMFWSGTIRNEQKPTSEVFMRNDQIDGAGRPMTWTTWGQRLQQAGVTWKYYQNDLTRESGMTKEQHQWLSNFGLNIFEFFEPYKVWLAPTVEGRIRATLQSEETEYDKLQQDKVNAAGDKLAKINRRMEFLRPRIAKLKECLEEVPKGLSALTPEQRELHERAFVINSGDKDYRSLTTVSFEEDGKKKQMHVPKGDVFYQFREDVKNNKLPQVSWLGAPEKFSDHPTSPWYGAWYVSEVMDILTSNPEVWKKTIFILTYDENDGYYDHCPSFVAADPKNPATGKASSGISTALDYTYAQDEIDHEVPAKQARSGPIGMGYRVPMIVASPWSRGGWVNSQLCDHTSNLQFMEHFFAKKGKKLHEPQISDWRRVVSGNLVSAFRPYDGKKPTLPFLNRDEFCESIERAKDKQLPTGFKALTPAEVASMNEAYRNANFDSGQEKGIRPSNALPYELYANAVVAGEKGVVQVHMKAGNEIHGDISAGSPFNVYLHNTKPESNAKAIGGKVNMFVATYAVKAGDTLPIAFPISMFDNGEYDIDVHAPNGFYRSFKGDAKAAQPIVQVMYEKKKSALTGNVEVLLKNPASSPMKVQIADHSYKTGTKVKEIPAGGSEKVLLDLASSHGWYDFTVKAEGSSATQRFAGRVETGKSSFTDPLMGRMV